MLFSHDTFIFALFQNDNNAKCTKDHGLSCPPWSQGSGRKPLVKKCSII